MLLLKHSGQLRLLQQSQFLPIPGALPCLPGRVRSSSEPDGGVSSRFPPNLLQARAWGRGGGSKIAPSEVPPAQCFSRGLNKERVWGDVKHKGTALRARNSRQERLEAFPSGSRGPLASEGAKIWKERGGKRRPAVLLQSSACLRVDFRPGSPAGERDQAAPKAPRASAGHGRDPACTGGFGVPQPP